MTVTALAHAAQTFRNGDWHALATRAFTALERDLCETVNGKPTGRLVHSARRVEKTVHQLDVCLAADLVHAAEAAIALYQSTGEAAYLQKAIGWMGSLESAYTDTQRGGYFENDDRTPVFSCATAMCRITPCPQQTRSRCGVCRPGPADR